MTLKLPAAPKSFYTPSLDTLKKDLETYNGASKGRVTLIINTPSDIEKAWNDVGAAHDSNGSYNRGQQVVGHNTIGTISDSMVGPVETESTEVGYKLQFGAVLDIPIYIDGTGISTATVIGVAMVKGVDTFALGSNSDVTYILFKTPILVTDGTTIDLEGYEVIIGYGEENT